jgi:hypothetical protein
MLTMFVGECRGGYVKITSDRDCLPPEIIRFDKRVFVDMEHVKTSVAKLEGRGFRVCVDTLEYFYETLEL